MGLWAKVKAFFGWSPAPGNHEGIKLSAPAEPSPPPPARKQATPATPGHTPAGAAKAPPRAKAARTLARSKNPAAGADPPEVHTATIDPARLQFQGALSKATAVDVVVGFDFGTSSSKVAIQAPFEQRSPVRFVDFGDLGHRQCSYLLPSALFRDEMGRLSLRNTGRSEVIPHLKVGLLDQTQDDERSKQEYRLRTALAAAYVGLALREARGTFLQCEAEKYSKRTVNWSMNLGIPSAGYSDEAMCERFQLIARAAWRLSLQTVPPTVDTAMEALDQPPSIDLEIIPEVTAEVITYAKAHGRRDDLHLIVDIGASTLDVCAFLLRKENGEDFFRLLTSNVVRLGLLNLHSRRMNAAKNQEPFHHVPTDITSPLPSWEGGDFSGDVIDRLDECDSVFIDECANLIGRVLEDVKKRRYPSSPTWEEGIPVFLCGGGANAPVGHRILESVEQKARQKWHAFGGLRHTPLPLPTGASGLRSHYGRLAVAHGLSFPALNTGRHEPESSVPDLLPDQPRSSAASRREALFIDKSQV